MERRDLAALAIYRNHKHCSCYACKIARAALAESDKRRDAK